MARRSMEIVVFTNYSPTTSHLLKIAYCLLIRTNKKHKHWNYCFLNARAKMHGHPSCPPFFRYLTYSLQVRHAIEIFIFCRKSTNRRAARGRSLVAFYDTNHSLATLQQLHTCGTGFRIDQSSLFTKHASIVLIFKRSVTENMNIRRLVTETRRNVNKGEDQRFALFTSTKQRRTLMGNIFTV